MRIWTILTFMGILYMFMYIKLISCLKGSIDIKRPITVLWIINIRSGASIFSIVALKIIAVFLGNTYILSDTEQLGTFIREKSKQMQCVSPYIASNVKIDSKLVSRFDENSEDNLETVCQTLETEAQMEFWIKRLCILRCEMSSSPNCIF